jgi:tetratricopeptide (TPR) repeat protein
MRRRTVLAGAAAALAGCATVEETVEEAAGPDGHPLAGEATVAVVDRSDSDHDLGALADEAMAFWSDSAARYAGFEVTFRRADEEPPDVEIEFLNGREDLDGCREYSSEEVLGCAPLVREGDRIDRPLTAEVVARRRPYGDVLTTTQHELGHILGLGHDDEPAYIMSNRIEDRLPEYEHRIEVLEAYQAAWETRNEGTRAYNEGIGRWNDGEYEAAIPRFERARERYAAIVDHVAAAEAAAGAFDEMNRPDTVDRPRLEDVFETLRKVADLSVTAAESMQAAAEAAADGNRQRARDRRADADEALEELSSIDAPTPADAGRALGLVRELNDEGANAATPSGS